MPEITRAGAVEVMGAAAIVHSSLPNSMEAALDALLAYLEANGWTVAPSDALDGMESVVRSQSQSMWPREDIYGDLDSMECEDAARNIYTTMLNAAPNPLAQETKDAG